MLFYNIQTWMSILLLSDLTRLAHAAPVVPALNEVLVREPETSTAEITAVSGFEKFSEILRPISERDIAIEVGHDSSDLAKRYLISSPYQKRTISLALKQALHGLAAGTTWVWEISYGYISNNGGASGHLSGNLVKGDGSFSWGPFKIDHAFVNKIDGIVTATFDAVVHTTNQKMSFTLTWAEEFASTYARLEDTGSSSSAIYYSPNGRQEHLSQAFFEYTIRSS